MFAAAACAGMGATLAPAAASGYKYVVPPVAYWPMVGDVGMGETGSPIIRYTDIAWLANAIGEFEKLKNDIFRAPRFYTPYYQTTNSLAMVILNPRTPVDPYAPSQEYVNFGASTSSPIPGYLDGNKDISASAALPPGYGGSLAEAWPIVANVSEANRWQMSSLFTSLIANSSTRRILLSSITDSYRSVKTLHSLKLVNSDTGISLPSSGYTIVTDGRSTEENPVAVREGTNWVWEVNTYTNTSFTGSIPPSIGTAGNFEYVAYAYTSKRYKALESGYNISPLATATENFDFYCYYSTTSGLPSTVLLNAPLAKVYNEGYAEIGSDVEWSSRIDTYSRVSLFSIRKYVEERFAATDAAGTHAYTNYLTTSYVLADTSGVNSYNIAVPTTSPYIGQFDRIMRAFLPYGKSRSFFLAVLGGDSDLATPCQNPRYPQKVDGKPDYMDETYRKVVIKVSHVWSISTLHPNYTCTFDGN